MSAPSLARTTTLAASVKGATKLRPVSRTEADKKAKALAARYLEDNAPAPPKKRAKKSTKKSAKKPAAKKAKSAKKPAAKKPKTVAAKPAALKKSTKKESVAKEGTGKASYTTMIADAMLHSRKGFIRGASRQALKKYVTDKFSIVVSAPAFRRALAKGVSDGIFTTNGARYKLSPAKRAALRKPKASKKKKVVKKKKPATKKKTATKKKKKAATKKKTAKKAAPEKAAPKVARKASASGKDEAPPLLKRVSSLNVIAAAGLRSGEVVVEGSNTYEANLAVVDMSTNTDKFYKLQVVESGGQYYLLQAWGRTGTAGQTKSTEHSDVDSAVKEFKSTFKSKAGAEWEDRDSYSAVDGKYSFKKKDYARVQKGDVMWKYYMDNGVDGKKDGWYDYTKDASATVEETFQEWQMNKSWLSIRSVESGHFSYRVNFNDSTQTNNRTNKTRAIKRFVDGKPGQN